MRTVLFAAIIHAMFLAALAVNARADWTGCYAGGHAGGIGASSEKWIVATPGGAFEGQSLGGHNLNGLIGGVQAGCDYQLGNGDGNGIVLGVQGAYGWANTSGTHPSALETGVFYQSEVEGIGAVTGRVGYGFDRVLLYGQGGAAWERVDYLATTTITGPAYTASETRDGWTAGGGAEFAVYGNVTAFVEYAHYDFGTERVRLTPLLNGLPVGYLDIEETANVVRAGVNLRFWSGR
jgi:outer membrane immunogenic protein